MLTALLAAVIALPIFAFDIIPQLETRDPSTLTVLRSFVFSAFSGALISLAIRGIWQEFKVPREPVQGPPLLLSYQGEAAPEMTGNPEHAPHAKSLLPDKPRAMPADG